MEEKSKNEEEGVDEGIEENASDGGSDSKKVSFNFIFNYHKFDFLLRFKAILSIFNLPHLSPQSLFPLSNLIFHLT